MGEPTVADAIMDRLLEHLHRIELSGESMRAPKRCTAGTAKGGKSPSRASGDRDPV